jgi:hypothetical protein
LANFYLLSLKTGFLAVLIGSNATGVAVVGAGSNACGPAVPDFPNGRANGGVAHACD